MSVDWLDELPLEPGPPTWSMGTRAVGLEGWLLPDADRDRDLAAKAALLAERHDEVFAALDTLEVRAASEEVRGLVEAATGTVTDPALHPLDAAARVVQEDLCLLVVRGDVPHLDAASLCFPSYWRPHYAEELGARVDGFLARLRPGRVVWRRNWSIHDDPTYFLPDPTPATDPVVPDGLHLRSERQTLRRLEATDAVLFTIRTQQVPLAAVGGRPDIARRMAAVIDAWSPETRAYKGGHG